ncbi:hypothetical protein [Pseudescherichia sp.]|uniref:hypothetical protein n=1 Tax=Pseudescherichia sp. TaxID=2055881 RepID=UPI0028AC08DC|nr:hypothetical protein [Pseudescherichia sp.]
MESKTKELVKAGHELVVLLGNQHGMIDAASLVQRLTAQLDITAAALREMTKKRDDEHADVLAWEKTMFKACGEDGTKSVAAKFASLEAERNQLAAENAALKTPAHWLAAADIGDQAAENAALTGANDDEQLLAGMVAIMESITTPTTDAWQREQRQKAWAEGINYAAGRLAAAFNHGFVNKPLAEVGDVVRMILDAKDELARATIPAPDGLSGEYAEKALEDWEQQLRNGEVNHD